MAGWLFRRPIVPSYFYIKDCPIFGLHIYFFYRRKKQWGRSTTSFSHTKQSYFFDFFYLFLLKKTAAETKTKAEILADLSKQWDTEDEDMEETETPAVTAPEPTTPAVIAPEPTPETGAPEEPSAPVPAFAAEEQQETAMETEQVK